MMSAIISDTLMFHSPTVTEVDKAAAVKLSEICGVEIDGFAVDMFGAGSSLSDKSAEEIFEQDYKNFSVNGFEFSVGQINSMNSIELSNIFRDFNSFFQIHLINNCRSTAQRLISKKYRRNSLKSSNSMMINNCILISTPYDTATVARLINQSMPIGYFMKRDKLTTFKITDKTEGIRAIMKKKRYHDFPVLDEEERYVAQSHKAVFHNDFQVKPYPQHVCNLPAHLDWQSQ